MPLSRDQLTGWPTRDDPHPGDRVTTKQGRLNGFPPSKEFGIPKPVIRLGPDPERLNAEALAKAEAAAEEKRKADMAARMEHARQVAAERRKLYEVYGVERPLRAPDKSGKLFSPSCKEAGCERRGGYYFSDEAEFGAHVVEAHGSKEKHERWRAMQETGAIA
jgi:hypothetical protein